MTPGILHEWKTHRSKFARTWQSTMTAKRKTVTMNVEPDQSLRSKIDSSSQGAAQQAMRKDVHLIEAALATDRTVFSLDDTARASFGALSGFTGVLKSVNWINPTEEPSRVSHWLRHSARAPKSWRLGG